ncbi:ABC transporter substrate-binding protein [Bradyrhizobium sp. STM 3562]|uniref:ABC transporter substrate-binding protein n=1 Tax=Bradyrhizobium sp. STM 3562 TaxID=578924 RepID=UPI00388F23D6
MTWSHPRGYDPLVACSEVWRRRSGVSITWEQRSLQDFESFPVVELAKRYDLIVIDHPHVGQITQEKCLLPLDVAGREAERTALEAASVGPSYPSYRWDGKQWAFPIDAATQVQAFRPDRLPQAPTELAEVMELARRGRVAVPLRPPHSLMLFYTLAAHLGQPCGIERSRFVDSETGLEAWRIIRELAGFIDPSDLDRDPIAVFERMVDDASAIDCVPFIYGYVSYAQAGFRRRLIRFANIPTIDSRKPVGAALGGTGIAVSAKTPHAARAIDFAYWIASAEVQRGPYAAAGGQCGHASAWDDPTVNSATAEFYRSTRATLEGSYVRPRHHGYMAFQAAASERINAALRAGENGLALLGDLNHLFETNLPIHP